MESTLVRWSRRELLKRAGWQAFVGGVLLLIAVSIIVVQLDILTSLRERGYISRSERRHERWRSIKHLVVGTVFALLATPWPFALWPTLRRLRAESAVSVGADGLLIDGVVVPRDAQIGMTTSLFGMHRLVISHDGGERCSIPADLLAGDRRAVIAALEDAGLTREASSESVRAFEAWFAGRRSFPL